MFAKLNDYFADISLKVQKLYFRTYSFCTKGIIDIFYGILLRLAKEIVEVSNSNNFTQ